MFDKGAVQEEIRFLISPECLASLIFCEKFEETESLWIVGSSIFSEYEGYGKSLRYIGRHISDINEMDKKNRLKSVICAIDAIKFKEEEQEDLQFRADKLIRELVKAFSGFCKVEEM